VDFLNSTNDVRPSPEDDEVDLPLIVHSGMLSDTDILHSDLDTLVIPENIEVTQIVGWGLDTIKGITYDADPECVVEAGNSIPELGGCLKRTPNFIVEGDATVVYPSADLLDAQTYYVDMEQINDEELFNRTHKNILEVDRVRSLLEQIIQE